MQQRLSLVLLAVVAIAALAAAQPPRQQPVPAGQDGPASTHAVEKRGLRGVLHKAHVKLSHAAHKLAPNLNKLKACLKNTPGVPAAVQGVVTGCASSASGGMGAIAACAAKKAAIPAARATSHLAVCMG